MEFDGVQEGTAIESDREISQWYDSFLFQILSFETILRDAWQSLS